MAVSVAILQINLPFPWSRRAAYIQHRH